MPDGQTPRHEQLLCFELAAASRAMTAVYRPLLDAVGLTYPQYLVLLLLWERSPRAMVDVGHVLELDSATLTPLLKRLEASGLVARARRRDDERAVEVRLTRRGLALEDRIAHVHGTVTCATGLDEAQVAGLRDRVRALRSSLRGAAGASAGAA